MSSKLQPAVQEELQAHLMWRYRIYLSTHHITFTFNGLTYSMSGHKSVGNLFRSSIKESTISENIIGSFDKDFSVGVVRSFEAMADNAAEHESAAESIVDKMMEKFHDYNSSSSDSDDGKDIKAKAATVKAKIYRLFGSEKPVHKVLGGGKPADIFLWREKKISAGVLGIATTIWVLFELLEYHLLTLACHILILALAILFLWSNASAFINKSSPQIPEVIIPEDIVLGVASAFRIEFNRALAILRDIASGRDLKQFLAVIAGLWLLSVLGSCWNFLTLIYIGLVLLHTVPVLYEKYEDQVDAFAEKAEAEIKKQYAVFNEKVLSKIPKGRLKDKKLA